MEVRGSALGNKGRAVHEPENGMAGEETVEVA